MKMTPVAGLLLAAFASACTRVDLAEPDGETKTHRYFGFVEVKVPAVEHGIEAYQTRSLGVAFNDGVVVGWQDEERVLVPLKVPEGAGAPYEATCSMVVIVRSDAEARHAEEILSSLKGENICLASFQ